MRGAWGYYLLGLAGLGLGAVAAALHSFDLLFIGYCASIGSITFNFFVVRKIR